MCNFSFNKTWILLFTAEISLRQIGMPLITLKKVFRESIAIQLFLILIIRTNVHPSINLWP